MSISLCFYPNGDPSLEEDIPCGSGSAVGCCPLNWSCQPNGLCYLEDQNYFGRYTCTDKDWGSGCPDICTYDKTAKGNEAVLECDTGSYCCDTNRPELSGGVNCCDASPSRFTIEGQDEISSAAASAAPAAPSVDIYVSFEAPNLAPVMSDSYTPDIESTIPSPTPVVLQEASLSASASASASALASASPLPSCDSDLGESLCGPICCAVGQDCAFPGQCYDSGSSVSPSTVQSNTISVSPSMTEKETVSVSFTASPGSRISTLSPYSTHSSIGATSSSPSSAAKTLISSITPVSPDFSTPTPIVPTSTATVTTVAPASPSASNTTALKYGLGFGLSFGILILGFVAFLLWPWWRRRNRQNNPVSYPTTTTGPQPMTPYQYDPTQPPMPNPYSQVFPANQPPADSSAFLGPGILPDHQRGQTRRSQPNLQHAPAQNPYSMFTSSRTSHSQPNLQHAPAQNPYSMPTSSRTSRSQPNLQHVPGQNPYGLPMSSQTGHSRSDLQHAPAQNPYAFPITSQSTIPNPPHGAWNQERWQGMSVSPPPSYATEDEPRRL